MPEILSAGASPRQRTMSAPAPDAKALGEAAEWFAILGDETAPPSAHAEWQQWLHASDSHRQAWHKVEVIGARLGSLQEPDRAQVGRILERVDTQRMSRRRSMQALAIMAAAGLCGWGAWQVSPWAAYQTASHRTKVGERKQYALSDGTQLWLNSASAVRVAYGQHERVVELLSGELWIESAKDGVQPPRDLIVDTPVARLRALGTQFTVWRDGDVIDLSVFDGAVQVEPRPTPGGAVVQRIVKAGQRLRMDANGTAVEQAASAERQLWRNGVLLAQEMRLDDFLRELARHRRGRIDCADGVADLRLIGVYQLGDTDAVLDSIEAALPVKVRRLSPWWVRVGAR